MKSAATIPLSAEEAKQQLVLHCALDRLHLRLLVRKIKNPPGNPITRVMAMADNALTFSQYFPGPAGRWARYLRSAASIARQIIG